MEKGKIALVIIAMIVVLLFYLFGGIKCDNCGKRISGINYKMYDKSYCDSCAHKLYPNVNWE